MLIQEYDPNWKTQFRTIKTIIQNVIGKNIINIEHIGSTAVQGLAAKPIIDMDIVYENVSYFPAIKQGLETLGYYHNGNQGIPEREVFKRKTPHPNHPELDNISHHLYACIQSSTELQRHLLFRNFLIKNKWAKTAYQNIKYDIADEANQDRKVYAVLKEAKAKAFISSCLEIAKIKSLP